MTPEKLSRIREIYERTLTMSGSDREAFLDLECRGNEEIRREVERLLKAREHLPAWWEQPLLAAARTFIELEPTKMEGRQLSGYTLIREIGRGGMGVVYLAGRSDGAFQKQAAIKLVLPAGNSASVIARFQQEREILASLDHPNIAKLLDGGLTEEGWPYFVMEFIDGQPIHRWCDERKLNISRRVELFGSVIAAVRYAHQRLVVHRDLKPSNILVTKDGIVKLLDFGIAKVLSTTDAGKPAETQTLAGMMTPEYASPEQVNGDAVTTLSDVYSLGVTLYELLTGHRPYRLLSSAMREMARVIGEVEPTRPSDVVITTEFQGGDRTWVTPDKISAVREGDPVRLRKRLAGDLDSILLMALSKEPEDRYGSVESFAEDLRRHLEHRPVKAREATPWYRARRFCRRNPGGVAAGSLVAILFFAGMASVVWQARHNLEAAPLDAGSQLFLAPMWILFAGIATAGLCAAVYFARPSKAKLLGAAAGGVVWAMGIVGKWWLGSNLGWWQSRFTDSVDPLMILAPSTWLIYPLLGMALLLILSMVGRRFGWKGQALFLTALGLYQETRERIWFTAILPALTFEPGLTPILGGAATLIAGGVMGLFVMRRLAGPDEASGDRK